MIILCFQVAAVFFRNTLYKYKTRATTQWHTSLGLGGADSLVERNHLVLRRDHPDDVLVVGELQLGDAFKTLLEMRLHAQRVFRLGQNLQQFVVRQEEKSANTQDSMNKYRVRCL